MGSSGPNRATLPLAEPSDAMLIARIATGDRGAVQVLFSRHHLRVRRFAARLTGDEALADDLLNEVFLDVWRQAGRFEARSSVTTWLLAITRNKAYATRRRRSDAPLDEDFAAGLTDDADDPEVQLQKRDKGTILRQCLNALSVEQREVMDLVYYQELSIQEVAEIVGIPENTVKSRMFNARKRLGELLKAAGVDRGWP